MKKSRLLPRCPIVLRMASVLSAGILTVVILTGTVWAVSWPETRTVTLHMASGSKAVVQTAVSAQIPSLQPGGAIPGGAVPDGAIPGGAVPGGAIPGGAVPGGAIPGGAMPGGNIQPPLPQNPQTSTSIVKVTGPSPITLKGGITLGIHFLLMCLGLVFVYRYHPKRRGLN